MVAPAALLAVLISCTAAVPEPTPSSAGAPSSQPATPANSPDPRPTPTTVAAAQPAPSATRGAAVTPTSGGPHADAGVILFEADSPHIGIWRYDGATGELRHLLLGHAIDQQGPAGAYVTAVAAMGVEKWRGPKLVGWDGMVVDDVCRSEAAVDIRSDGACLYAHPEGVFVRRDRDAPAKKLLPADWGATAVAWSPGGARSAFIRAIPGAASESAHHSVWILEPDGSLRRIHDAGQAAPRDLRWSPDGVYVSFRSSVGRHPDSRTVMTIADSLTGRVSQVEVSSGLIDDVTAWSPRGDLAFVSGSRPDSWNGGELLVRHSDGRITSVMGANGGLVSLDPAWHPIRGHLAWVAGPASSDPAGRDAPSRRGYVGSVHSPVDCPGGPVEGLRWSTDGEHLLLLCRALAEPDRTFELWLLATPEGRLSVDRPRQLVSGIRDASRSRSVAWSRAVPPIVSERADTGRFSDSDPCPPFDRIGVGSPAAAGCLSHATGDFDGDGAADKLMIYADTWTSDRAIPAFWNVKIAFASGNVHIGRLDGIDSRLRPLTRIAGDANGDGRDEIFIHLDHGASTEFWAMYLWDGSGLVAAREGGEPLRLPVFGSTGHGAGFRCSAGVLEVLGAGRIGPDPTYNWTRRTLEWTDHRTLTEVAVERGTAKLDTSGLPGSLDGFWSADCPSAQSSNTDH